MARKWSKSIAKVEHTSVLKLAEKSHSSVEAHHVDFERFDPIVVVEFVSHHRVRDMSEAVAGIALLQFEQQCAWGLL